MADKDIHLIREGDSNRLHDRVTEALLEMMSNRWTDGNRMPSEESIAADLGVSRVTLRESLLNLEREGLITRKHGLGTFIHRNAMNAKARLELATNFAQAIKKSGYQRSQRSLRQRREEADSEIADRLSVPVGTMLLVLEWLHSADGMPAILAINRIPVSLIKGDIGKVTARESIFEVYNRRYGLEAAYRVIRYKAANASEDVAERISLAPGDAVFSWEEVVYNLRDIPVAYSQIYYNLNIIPLYSVRQIPV